MRTRTSLAPDAPDRVRFFGMDAALGEAAAVSDAPRCIFCGAEYEYDYHTFAHLGGFRCPQCGYSRAEPDVAIVEVDALAAHQKRLKYIYLCRFNKQTPCNPASNSSRESTSNSFCCK